PPESHEPQPLNPFRNGLLQAHRTQCHCLNYSFENMNLVGILSLVSKRFDGKVQFANEIVSYSCI
ncbi:MAG: hypothetical protein AABZ76_10345, partial [Pseudomonadota bacterium]